METSLEGPSQPPLSCGKPKYIVVVLHAAGSDGDEVIGLALDWAPTLGKAEFLAPHAPWAGEPGGIRQWADPTVDGLQAHTAYSIATERLNEFVDAALARRKLDGSQLALVGFAQGAELALRTALQREQALGAVVAIAGSLGGIAGESGPVKSKPPVLLVEADLEPKSDPESLAGTERALNGQGISVQRVGKPGDYFGLDDEGITLIADYLHQILVKSASDDDHH